jgi:hypothetical protein
MVSGKKERKKDAQKRQAVVLETMKHKKEKKDKKSSKSMKQQKYETIGGRGKEVIPPKKVYIYRHHQEKMYDSRKVDVY